MRTTQSVLRAFHTSDIETFLDIAFPPEWKGIAARILESGATFHDGDPSEVKWAPRWSKIPLTKRYSTDGSVSITAMKSIIFRVHDCLHQLWGLPHPGEDYTEDDFYYYKRSQMCGEVAVLTLAEFSYAKWLYNNLPESFQPWILSRNALPMMMGSRREDAPLQGKSILQIAQRLDDLLHKRKNAFDKDLCAHDKFKPFPKWVRENIYAQKFVEDYVPMLQKDRSQIDKNWKVMKEAGFQPDNAPNVRYGRHMDGLELTSWMIQDFEHLKSTDPEVDKALMEFNRERRSKLVLPDGWDS